MTRLNLGCGDKILEGYVNVDVVGERAGATPDISCDITDFSIFEGNYADEILVVHVVEHFRRWELVDVDSIWRLTLISSSRALSDRCIHVSFINCHGGLPSIVRRGGPVVENTVVNTSIPSPKCLDFL